MDATDGKLRTPTRAILRDADDLITRMHTQILTSKRLMLQRRNLLADLKEKLAERRSLLRQVQHLIEEARQGGNTDLLAHTETQPQGAPESTEMQSDDLLWAAG